MQKNIAIGLLTLLVVVESGYIIHKKLSPAPVPTGNVQGASTSARPSGSAGPNATGGRQMILAKGDNLKTSALANYVYEIAPTVTDDAKKAMTGFNIKSETQKDGSTLVTLTPKDSDDQYQSYVVQKGQMLYFVEQTPADDKNDQDKDLNYRDDYGIITDANGIIQ